MMGSVPIDPDPDSPALESLLGRIRDGLRAEEELVRRYLELYARKTSPPHRVLSAIYRRPAEEAGTDIVSLVGILLVDRTKEIEDGLNDFATPETFESRVTRLVRREIWRLLKRKRRGPTSGGDRLGRAEGKGYQPGSNGDPRSTVLFAMWNERLESAIGKVRGKTEHQRQLYEVLARLHVLKGWEYAKLARLVYGPGLEPEELKRAAERVRKWIEEPVRHVKAEKKRNEAKRKRKPGDAADVAIGEGPTDDGPTGDDRS